MFQYIASFVICSIIFFAIQYYFNNFSSTENNQFFNNGYNRYYIFIALFILINTIMHMYFKNSFSDIVEKGKNTIENIGGSSSNVNGGTNLKVFENEFINTIKNQEIEVGLAPF
jgi:hypothetical protein